MPGRLAGGAGSGYLRNGAIVSLKNEKDPARLAARWWTDESGLTDITWEDDDCGH